MATNASRVTRSGASRSRSACIRRIRARRRRVRYAHSAPPTAVRARRRELPFRLDASIARSWRARHAPATASTRRLGRDASPRKPLATRHLFDPYTRQARLPDPTSSVNGTPLIWLDNAATTQKPQSVIDRLAHFYEHENSNIHRAAHTLAARSTDAYEAAREKVRRFLNAPSAKDIIFVRGATEGINLVAQSWGRRNVREGDEIVITHLEHHANIVPWQQLCAEKGAKLRVAPVDDRGADHPRRVREAAQPEDADRRVHAGLERARHDDARRGDDGDRASPRRLRAGRRRAVGVAHAGRRAGARLRLLRLLRPQDVRPDRHRRRLRQGAVLETCRRGRAAAT